MKPSVGHWVALAFLCASGVCATLSKGVPSQQALFAALAGIFASLSTAVASYAPSLNDKKG
jgi:hypothetical protein